MTRLFVALAVLLSVCVGASAQTTTDFEVEVQKMYVAYYGRPGDDGGVKFWAEQLSQNNGDLSAIIDSFANSEEFQERFGDLDNEQLVDNIYQQLFGRGADPEGLKFYVDHLVAGTKTLGTIALDIANGAQPDNDDGLIIANKLTVAEAFTEAVQSANLRYSVDEIVYAKQIIDEVGSLPSSVDAALDLFENTLALFPSLDAVRVTMSTADGDIVLELYSRESPITVANFLAYVERGAFDGTVFHRVVPGFVVQGGGFRPDFDPIDTDPAIVNESVNGLSNVRGTVAMARTSNPDSTTSQYFINLVDNLGLDYDDGEAGYAVFAVVVQGMDIVDAMATVATGNVQTQFGTFQDVPLEDIVLESARRNE